MNSLENKNREETIKYYLKCIEDLLPLDNLILYNAMENILIQLWYNAYKFGGDNNEDMQNKAYEEGREDGYKSGIIDGELGYK